MELTAGQMSGVGAGALIYSKRDAKFLLAKRSERCDDPNTWCCFGGGVERNESLEQGVHREFKEEFGVDLDCHLYEIHRSHIEDEEGHLVFTYHNYLGIVETPFPGKLNDEHTEYGWFAADNLPMPLHPEFLKALRSPKAQALLTSLKGV